MEAWVRAKVERLGLDADVYVEYGRGILEDEDMEIEERVESVIGIFTGAADGLASDDVIAQELQLAVMIADVERIMQQQKQLEAEEEDLKYAENQMRDMQLREQEKKAAEEAKEKEKEKANARLNMYVTPCANGGVVVGMASNAL